MQLKKKWRGLVPTAVTGGYELSMDEKWSNLYGTHTKYGGHRLWSRGAHMVTVLEGLICSWMPLNFSFANP